jgi:very-short-patch-repair endonuclease
MCTKFEKKRAAVIAAYARQHRHSPTESEERMWKLLRGGKLGVTFRRQVPLGRYIADFFAKEIGLVVEVDGGYHRGREKADARRDEWMRRRGYVVVRVRG